MLKADELKEALQDAVKAGEKCGRFCTHGATIEDDTYVVFHNGTGNRDTDAQVIYSVPVRNLAKDPLTKKLRTWVVDLHSGNKLDLNATMATGGPVSASEFSMIGEDGPECVSPHAHSIVVETGTTGSLDHQHAVWWTTCYRLDHLHLHWEGSCSIAS
jgi:hypothetical protein